MKARILITPKSAMPDPEGKAIQDTLERLGYTGIRSVRMGKCLEIDLVPGAEPESTRQSLEDACRRFLTHSVLEDFQIEILD